MNAKGTLMIAPVVTLCGALGLGCDDRESVQEAMGELQSARQNTGNVAGELRSDLKQAKQHVAVIEKKLALAERGITDEVLEQRRELVEALKRDGEDVSGEIAEVRGSAREHNELLDESRKLLQQTQPPGSVEARGQSIVVDPEGSPIHLERREESIVLEDVHGAPGQQDNGDPAEVDPDEPPRQ